MSSGRRFARWVCSLPHGHVLNQLLQLVSYLSGVRITTTQAQELCFGLGFCGRRSVAPLLGAFRRTVDLESAHVRTPWRSVPSARASPLPPSCWCIWPRHPLCGGPSGASGPRPDPACEGSVTARCLRGKGVARTARPTCCRIGRFRVRSADRSARQLVLRDSRRAVFAGRLPSNEICLLDVLRFIRLA
jgi:hypothetical protein